MLKKHGQLFLTIAIIFDSIVISFSWFAAFYIHFKTSLGPPPRYANPHQMILAGLGRKDLLPAAKTLKLKWGAGGHLRIETLANGLKKFGPVWAAGNWNQAFHVILLVGAVVSKKMPMVIYINPWTQYGGSQELTKTLKWFNEGRGHWKNVNGSLIHW